LVRFDSAEDSFTINNDASGGAAQRDLAATVCELGWLYCHVNSYIESVAKNNAAGLVSQSFASAMRDELTEYYRLLAILEEQASNISAPGTNAF
jgi:gamma-tubulin complex component 3